MNVNNKKYAERILRAFFPFIDSLEIFINFVASNIKFI